MDKIEDIIFEKIINAMDVDRTELEGFTYDSPIFNSDNSDEVNMGLDSMDALELVVVIHSTWGIDVPAEDMHLLTTVNKIAEYIRAHEDKK